MVLRGLLEGLLVTPQEEVDALLAPRVAHLGRTREELRAILAETDAAIAVLVAKMQNPIWTVDGGDMTEAVVEAAKNVKKRTLKEWSGILAELRAVGGEALTVAQLADVCEVVTRHRLRAADVAQFKADMGQFLGLVGGR